MADDEKKPNNVIQFEQLRRQARGPEAIDMLLDDARGEYEEIIIVGIEADGYMTVTASSPDVGEVYEALMSAATNVALVAIDGSLGKPN